MNAFTYQMPVTVYFGQGGVRRHLADELSTYGPNIMIAYGGGSVIRNGIYDEVTQVLKDCGKNIIDLPGIPANPTYGKVQEGIRLCKEYDVDLILAVGGGSVVDCVKIITAGTEVNEDIWELEINQHKIPERMGSYAVILTLSGAGAEMDNLGAVINEGLGVKRTLVGSYAKFAILDPDYIMTAPLDVFMPGVYDTLSHCMETYFGRGYNVSDRMNEGLMKDVIANMRELIRGNDTLEVRSNCMWDSSLIQTFLFACGKSGDFQVHQIENMLGAFSHGTHGRQLAVLQPAYYRYVYRADPAKFATFAKDVMGVDGEGDDEKVAERGIAALEQLIRDAGLATTFGELGYVLTEDVARKVSELCGISTTNARQLARDEVFDLLMSCS